MHALTPARVVGCVAAVTVTLPVTLFMVGVAWFDRWREWLGDDDVLSPAELARIDAVCQAERVRHAEWLAGVTPPD
jgi:hypothetical protein